MRFTFKYVKVNDFKDDPPLSLRLLFKCGLQSRKYTSPFLKIAELYYDMLALLAIFSRLFEVFLNTIMSKVVQS